MTDRTEATATDVPADHWLNIVGNIAAEISTDTALVREYLCNARVQVSDFPGLLERLRADEPLREEFRGKVRAQQP